MASNIEFPEINDKEKAMIGIYFDAELEFMATKNFYRNPRNIFFRRHAVAMISKLSWRIDLDTLIPYLAMNYFDRFFSKRSSILEDVEGFVDTEKVRLVAIACLTISAKRRIKNFSIDQFLITNYREVNVRISHHMVMRTELLILHELHWELLAVTPFTFLNYYHRYFKSYGGFRRRCINELIVQAQGEHPFVHFYPSMIAMSAFLVASRIAYPLKYREIATPFKVARVCPEVKLFDCVDDMFDLCKRLNIQIETPESETPSTSNIMESQQNKGKGLMVMLVDSFENDDAQEGTSLMRRVDSFENDDAQEGTSLMRRSRDMNRMTNTSQELKISDGVEEEIKELPKDEEKVADTTETSDGDNKARVEGIIRRPSVEGKAPVSEKMEEYISEIAELEERKSLMIFELKWPGEVPSTEPQSPTANSRLNILRAGQKLTCGGCKVG